MTPSPFSQPLNQKISRVNITVSGEPNSGKSALAANIVAALRAQGFQAGLKDQYNDQPVDRVRFSINTIVNVDVAVPVPAGAVVKSERETQLEAQVATLGDQLNAANNAKAQLSSSLIDLQKQVIELQGKLQTAQAPKTETPTATTP